MDKNWWIHALVFLIGLALAIGLVGLSSALILVFIAVVVIPIYFIPSIVAFKGGHEYKAAVLALNALLGWTFIFWVFSLVWALATKENSSNEGVISKTQGTVHFVLK